MATNIEWTDETWNPVRGCTKVSVGCKNCYAETFAERWRGIPGHPYEQGFDLRLVPEKLDEPLHWKKPRMIFVNSMSDLFHKDVPFDYIDKVFAVMARCPQHTFQILTKRPERMAEYLRGVSDGSAVDRLLTLPNYQRFHKAVIGYRTGAPLSNVWLGTSVENQEAADKRILELIKTPAAVRFLSCEPLLGPVNLHSRIGSWHRDGSTFFSPVPHSTYKAEIDWCIIGGESGHHARPMELEWARSLVGQCKAAGVACFVKQLGGKVDKRGNLEDFPPELRIREFPQRKTLEL